MSTDDKEKCPSEHQINQETFEESKDVCGEEVCGSKKKSCPRKVSFPEEDLIVTQYFEPANPWQDGKRQSWHQFNFYIFPLLVAFLSPFRN